VSAALPNDPHIMGSQSAGFSIIGNAPFTLTATPLDATGKPITGVIAPTITASSSSTAVTLAQTSATTFTLEVHAFSATPVQVTLTPSRGTGSTFNVTTVQELWVTNFANGTGTTMTGYAPAVGILAPIDTYTQQNNDISAPDAVAVDASGNLWVANVGGGNVIALAPGGTPIPADMITMGLAPPTALAFDGSGKLWVTNGVGTTITAYVPGTNTVANTISGLSCPFGLAFDSSGTLWVANAGANEVLAYASGSTTPIANDTITTNVSDPVAVELDGQGNIWVANFNINTVTAYATATGAQVTADTITAVNAPRALTFDAHGTLWVSNSSTNTVNAYQPGTNAPIVADTITGLNDPAGLVFVP